jgi:hypothetical protein
MILQMNSDRGNSQTSYHLALACYEGFFQLTLTVW